MPLGQENVIQPQRIGQPSMPQMRPPTLAGRHIRIDLEDVEEAEGDLTPPAPLSREERGVTVANVMRPLPPLLAGEGGRGGEVTHPSARSAIARAWRRSWTTRFWPRRR